MEGLVLRTKELYLCADCKKYHPQLALDIRPGCWTRRNALGCSKTCDCCAQSHGEQYSFVCPACGSMNVEKV